MKQSSLIKFVSAVAAVFMFAGSVQAAGFSIYEASARGNSMGGALVGSTGDASAVAYNPANMTENSGLQTLAGLTFIQPFADVKFSDGSVTKMHDQYFYIPHAYATWQMTDSWWFGFGQYTEFGLGTKYPADWKCAYSSYETDLETTTFNPSLAYKVTEKFSLGLGFRLMYIDFSSKSKPFHGIPSALTGGVPFGQRTLTIAGDDLAMGWNGGAQYKIDNEWSVGFTYRSPTWAHIKGSADLSREGVPGVVPDAALGNIYTHADGKLVLPPAYTLGANYKPNGTRWNFGSGITYTQWSTYEMLNINLNENLGGISSNPLGSNKGWNDVFRFSFGSEYGITDRLFWRAGYVYDMDPTNPTYGDTMLPAGNRNLFSTGFGYYITQDINIDLAYTYLMGVDEGRTIKGSVPALQTESVVFENSGAHMLAISAGIKF